MKPYISYQGYTGKVELDVITRLYILNVMEMQGGIHFMAPNYETLTEDFYDWVDDLMLGNDEEDDTLEDRGLSYM
ncbi:hypothetical protein LQE88_06040 [Acidaminococcus sp. NSJ-142]|jgi:hypothetical protein|uniref:hypothetical protein n=1 Tax=Acidaminococcus TaxID=904 RepID=UPI000CFA7EF9|nr:MULTISPECIES: hypothetical protein [Acidaminococcus]MCD2435548.1 hypothetical protein [Acidaminococcus hominis]MCH4095535.1 hypothetical protein [Acidaminococcus provencensis]RHK01826.1 hypothetical protein DW089_06200 [Acidaminococcus sp. AM05-11]